MATRLKIAKPDIVRYFDELPQKVLRLADLQHALKEQRDFWRLAQNTTTKDLAAFLIEQGKLREYRFPFSTRSELRYVWGKVPLLEIVGSLKEGGYFTHFTAMRLHGLTEQLPKTIYFNHEQRPHVRSDHLEQRSLDAAFKAKPRVTSNIIEHGNVRICLLNGMHTGGLGVVTERAVYDDNTPVQVRVTNIERTLIDIVVRPAYSGGVAEVLKAFERAREQASVNRLMALLQKLNYLYPYHQAIGFYLERAGYSAAALDLVRQLPLNYDFYLAHQMGPTDFVPQWRLHIPKGF